MIIYGNIPPDIRPVVPLLRKGSSGYIKVTMNDFDLLIKKSHFNVNESCRIIVPTFHSYIIFARYFFILLFSRQDTKNSTEKQSYQASAVHIR